ncbi:MAG: PstS family phosphate ABC transporter substrate-binding protein [Planctomycetota bacterium]
MKVSPFPTGFVLTMIIAVASMMTWTGCDSESSMSEPTGSGGEISIVSDLVGQIRIDGSSTVQPISNAIRETFIVQHPGVNIDVGGNGTGNGFESFAIKGTDISDASRPIKPSEFEKCREAGVRFLEIPVAYDGLTIVVNPGNDWVKQLTVDQLKLMFVGDDAAQKWSDVDESWPDETINIFAPGTGSGTYDYFHEVVAKKDEKELRDDMNLNEDDNILVQGVAGNQYSIGFFGKAYYDENKERLRAVPIVNPKDETAYLPTTENIAASLYAPFSRPLFIYVNSESLNRAEVTTFVEYYLDNAVTASEAVGYIRLPDSVTEAARANFDNEVTGTHFVDGDDNRSGPLTELFVPENLTD